MASEKLYRNTLTLTIFQGTGPWTCTLLPNCFKRSLEVMSYESPLLWVVIWGIRSPTLYEQLAGFFTLRKKFLICKACAMGHTLYHIYIRNLKSNNQHCVSYPRKMFPMPRNGMKKAFLHIPRMPSFPETICCWKSYSKTPNKNSSLLGALIPSR